MENYIDHYKKFVSLERIRKMFDLVEISHHFENDPHFVIHYFALQLH